MPELPEVETTLRGITPFLENQRLRRIVVRDPRLRWPVVLPDDLPGQRFVSLERRAKYLKLHLERGFLLLHLGMSGSLQVVSGNRAPDLHDHVDLELESGWTLRFNDPRRFGSLHWQDYDVDAEEGGHWLLRDLGPEPLAPAFDGAHLKQRARGRRQAVKLFIMDARTVVGVGNIYANEALFLAGIRPGTAARRLSRPAFDELALCIKQVLAEAIEVGGTTLRDFVDSQGQPGYFQQQLNVYGREGQPCRRCDTVLKGTRLGQRATVYCPNCQRSQGFLSNRC
ncbi:MAG: bifunctional DNA-formamidopyrimidine glycosylase/DNA-(apurinic or apyrimidinic site) lyase [Pseudomonadota bacterium]